MLDREENIGALGSVTSVKEVRTLVNRVRCYVAIRICEAASIEQIYISLVVLPGISLDAY